MPRGTRSAVLQRILFPMPGDDAARALYVRAEQGSIAWTRESLTLAPGASASLATYFAALPVGEWQASTTIGTVRLVCDIDGSAMVRVCGANETVQRQVVDSCAVSGAFTCDIPPTGFTWLWLEIDAGAEGATLSDAAWVAQEVVMPTTTVCITTHNRGEDCVGVLTRLADDEEVLELVDRIHLVDQGDRPVREAEGFAAAAAALGGRLHLVEQPNLGGSGGFSRGLIESLEGSAPHALLLDDDVLLEPESIRRMLAFAARARHETVIGAQMLSLTDRTRLHSVGERIDRGRFWWTPVEPDLAPVDLAVATIESTPGLRRVHEVDYNGWWMCLIPLDVVRRVGAALPFFIKWDDAEFGLRAADSGVRTVTLPGAALWHMPWTGKDDGLDWQSYFQLRNRIVSALVHSRSPRGAGTLAASFAQDVNHIICMQYGSAAARRVALRDVLQGPDHLPQTIARRADEMRSLLVRAGQVVVDEAALPAAHIVGGVRPPTGSVRALSRLLLVAAHQLTRPRIADDGGVERALTRAEGKWWALGRLDSATVVSATGRGAFVARRDRRTAIALLRDAIALRVRLWLAWPRLVRAYGSALPELTSAAAWRRITTPSADGQAVDPG